MVGPGNQMVHQTANATSLTFSNHPQGSAMLANKGV